jgi:heptosyltransferase I
MFGHAPGSVGGAVIPHRIGIVLMSALGDVTLGLPVACAIKRAAPRTRVTWIAQPGPLSLLAGHPCVDEVVPFDRHGGLAAYRTMRTTLATRPFDVVLDLQPALKAGLVTACARAARKIGIDRRRSQDANWLFTTERVPPRARAHLADQFLEFLAPIGVPVSTIEYGLTPSQAARQAVNIAAGDESRPLVTVVVASSKPMKNWAPERLAALCIALVAEFGLRPVLVGADTPVEREATAVIMRQASAALPPDDRPLLAMGCGIPNLLAWLERSALVVSPDSGPLHLAVALDRPVIGLYGATNPLWVGPFRRFDDLLVDRYHAVGESPRSTSAKRPGRMDHITVADVLDRVARWRTHYAGRAARPPAGAADGLLSRPRSRPAARPATVA